MIGWMVEAGGEVEVNGAFDPYADDPASGGTLAISGDGLESTEGLNSNRFIACWGGADEEVRVTELLLERRGNIYQLYRYQKGIIEGFYWLVAWSYLGCLEWERIWRGRKK